MPIFHRAAYEAACTAGQPAEFPELSDEHFETEDALDEALGWLTHEQRCDALYCDWLLQGGRREIYNQKPLACILFQPFSIRAFGYKLGTNLGWCPSVSAGDSRCHGATMDDRR